MQKPARRKGASQKLLTGKRVMGARRKARESALQILFGADLTGVDGKVAVSLYLNELSDLEADQITDDFAEKLVVGTLQNQELIDERIRSRAEHWRISRMAIVDRNVLRLAIYEFLFESTPHTVVINEALEIARRFSSYEATQFINGILDAVKHDLENERKNVESNKNKENPDEPEKRQVLSA